MSKPLTVAARCSSCMGEAAAELTRAAKPSEIAAPEDFMFAMDQVESGGGCSGDGCE